MPPIHIDPALFHPDAIDDETAQINANIEALLKDTPSPERIGAKAIRASRRAGQGLLPHQPLAENAYWHTAAALGKEIEVRIFPSPKTAQGVLLHIHGGGQTLGAADAQDTTLTQLAVRLDMTIVSVDYRLSPEHPYPAANEDCETAALWLFENARAVFGTDRLFIQGESAGAHLSAVTLLRLRHRHDVMPFQAASLVYGQYDLNGLPAVHNWGTRNLIISTPIIKWFKENYLPSVRHDHATIQNPDISPLYGDLKNLCPALFTVGTLDPLIDDSILMAYKWAQAGNHAALEIYAGGIHGFNQLPDYAIGEKANACIDKFILSY